MRVYFAPMEGITGYLYRQAHHRCFGGVDRYYMPFLSPGQGHRFTRRDLQDVLPEHNQGLRAVPQLLTKRSEDFLWCAGALADMGYGEVNLNLGCPSGTVAAKGKGSGFLAFPEALDRFLEEIFAAAPVKISVKTRLGVRDPDEFGPILEIYNKYPIAELTIHPRVQKDFYKNHVRLDHFAAALAACRCPVCYNGDLAAVSDCAACSARFPAAQALMLGRGLIADPALARKLRGGPGASREELRAFHDGLYRSYAAAFGSERNAMLRMKEVWFYLIHLFQDGERLSKRIKKAADPRDFEGAAAEIFQSLPLRADAQALWQPAESCFSAQIAL